MYFETLGTWSHMALSHTWHLDTHGTQSHLALGHTWPLVNWYLVHLANGHTWH